MSEKWKGGFEGVITTSEHTAWATVQKKTFKSEYYGQRLLYRKQQESSAKAFVKKGMRAELVRTSSRQDIMLQKRRELREKKYILREPSDTEKRRGRRKNMVNTHFARTNEAKGENSDFTGWGGKSRCGYGFIVGAFISGVSKKRSTARNVRQRTWSEKEFLYS